MPKRTIYIKEGDLPLWVRAEQLAGDESVSAVLGEALQQYLEGQKTLRGTVRFREGADVVTAAVQPVSGGWLLGVPPGPEGDAVVAALRTAGVWPDRFPVPSAPPGQQLWVWVPADTLAAMWMTMERRVGGVDYQELARQAWGMLREAAVTRQTLSYSALGEQLGGLHPYRQVPQVLDVIEKWCLDHKLPDLTGVIVSQRSGLPGEDYWRQNGWTHLSVAERVDRWREQQDRLATIRWDATAPF